MKRKLLDLIPGFVLLLAFSVMASPPQRVDAAATASFSQVILEPDCYDYVTTTSTTVDYIATFDCQIRRPDGTALDGSRISQGTVSLR